MIIVGHRGARGLAPENTVKAIRAGLLAGADMLEVDLRVKGGEIVLSHDDTVRTESYEKLADALKVLNGKVPIILEIKESEVVPLLPAALEDYRGDFIFSSKRYNILDEVRRTMPNSKVAVTEPWSGVRAITEASLLSTDELHINHNWLWSGFVRSMKHKGYKLYAYTVNTVERAEELESWGIDGIITDYPNLFKDKT